jgi:hypothetical protein
MSKCLSFMFLGYVEIRGTSHHDMKIESAVAQPVTNVRPAPELGLGLFRMAHHWKM